jgi:hypothetical protein
MEPRQDEPLSLVHKYKTRMEVTDSEKHKITKLIYNRKFFLVYVIAQPTLLRIYLRRN